DLLAQLHAHFRVERRERLVEEQHTWLDRERAGESHALLHAARELMRVAVGRRSEPDELEQLADAPATVLLLPSTDLQPELDILARRHVWEQRVRLEDHPHVALVGRDVRHVLAVDDDTALVGPVEAGNEAQGGRLPAAGRSEQ